MNRMPGDLRKVMQQAQKMQAEMHMAQDELAQRTFEATAGGGVVNAVVTGGLKVVSVTLAPSVLDPDDPELVGDLVVAAVNQALEAAHAAGNELMGGVPGLDLGGLGGLLGG